MPGKLTMASKIVEVAPALYPPCRSLIPRAKRYNKQHHQTSANAKQSMTEAEVSGDQHRDLESQSRTPDGHRNCSASGLGISYFRSASTGYML